MNTTLVNAQKVWVALEQEAGRSSEVPSFSVSQLATIADLNLTSAIEGLNELLQLGAVVVASDEAIMAISAQQRIPGLFVVVDSDEGEPLFLQIHESRRLQRVLVAQRELMRRERSCLLELQQATSSRIQDPVALTQFETIQLCSLDTIAKLQRVSQQLEGETPVSIRALAGDHVVTADDVALAEDTDEEELIRACRAARNNQHRGVTDRLYSILAAALSPLPQLHEISCRLATLDEEKERLMVLLELAASTTSTVPSTGISREPIPKNVQQEVWRRDQGRCVMCGSQEKLEFDHIIPLSRGGANTARNLQLLCESCNRSKGNRI